MTAPTPITAAQAVLKMGTATIGAVTNFKGPGGSTTILDATTLDSTAKEKLPGLPDEGSFTFDLNYDPIDVNHQALRDARAARTKETFTLALQSATVKTLSWSGFVTGFAIQGSPDTIVTASVTVEVTGAVTIA